MKHTLSILVENQPGVLAGWPACLCVEATISKASR